jgi:uncharacterized protein (DUF1499 family)
LLRVDLHGFSPVGGCRDGSIFGMFSWQRPANLGVTNGRFAPCKRSPNCVSSQADPADSEHYIPSLASTISIPKLRMLVESMPGATIIKEQGNYLYAEFRSRLLGFVDDLELFSDGKAIQVRSASRLGRRDFGVNRKRVEALRALIQARR